MKKVLILMGSARRKDTDSLVKSLISGIDQKKYEVTRVNFAQKNIGHCTGCDYCGMKGICIIDDDMEEIYELIDYSDIIVYAGPIYFNSVNSVSKALIDRTQRYWSLKYSLGENYKRGEDRIGIALVAGGAPYHHDQFDGIYPVLNYFFKAINADYKANYFVSNTDKIPVSERKDVKEDMISLGNRIGNFNGFTIQK